MKKVAWWTLTVCVWIIVFPVTAVTGVALMVSGVVAPIAGIVNLVARVLGFDLDIIQLGTIHPGPWLGLLLTVAVGILLVALGWLLWKATVTIHRWLMGIKPQRTRLSCPSCGSSLAMPMQLVR
ncbi:MAG: hypothetical protein SPJ68_07285 [Arcanobacterium sp.]|nr:hypothetical protein [Arcanobacterium sp.]